MRLHRIDTTHHLRIRLDEAWAFFSDPRNLGRITPPSMRFEILSPLPARVYPGLLITYRVRPLLGLPVTWITEITQVVEPRLFVDEQRFGPYRFWHHLHMFREVDDGTEMRDIVHYALPIGILGRAAHGLLVAPRLREIFEFRRRRLDEIFGQPAVAVGAPMHAGTRGGP